MRHLTAAEYTELFGTSDHEACLIKVKGYNEILDREHRIKYTIRRDGMGFPIGLIVYRDDLPAQLDNKLKMAERNGAVFVNGGRIAA